MTDTFEGFETDALHKVWFREVGHKDRPHEWEIECSCGFFQLEIPTEAEAEAVLAQHSKEIHEAHAAECHSSEHDHDDE